MRLSRDDIIRRPHGAFDPNGRLIDRCDNSYHRRVRYQHRIQPPSRIDDRCRFVAECPPHVVDAVDAIVREIAIEREWPDD